MNNFKLDYSHHLSATTAIIIIAYYFHRIPWLIKMGFFDLWALYGGKDRGEICTTFFGGLSSVFSSYELLGSAMLF